MSSPELETRAEFGRYRGQLLDDSSRRSLRMAADEQERLAQRKLQRVIVDDFYHQGTFWRASIPLGVVDRVFGQAFNFSKLKLRRGNRGLEPIYDDDGLPRRTLPLNHLQTRFCLREGAHIELYSLDETAGGGVGPLPGTQPDGSISTAWAAAPGSARVVHRIDDFVYSLEAVGPLGVNFNFWDGIGGNLICAHRFLSTEEMVFERIVVEGQYVLESPPLPLSDLQKQNLLTAAVLRSATAGMNEQYYLFRCFSTNNCTSTPLRILDEHVEYSFRRRLAKYVYRLPLAPRTYLRLRGLDADPSQRRFVRQEFADYISTPATQQRKRRVVRDRIAKLRTASGRKSANGRSRNS